MLLNLRWCECDRRRGSNAAATADDEDGNVDGELAVLSDGEETEGGRITICPAERTLLIRGEATVLAADAATELVGAGD